ncbi:Hypothetical protein SRAE_1000278900 [Strongyloides ratti]|uniref:Uncharacterized protein n=1 Tax=Strongyloides ratti TaxID=34506 RepID=A0A090LAG8_STRRB|nr:Hypothetical protein SRAE_1000278900 [Strongyloides ratti]CEF64535.1 Hypothetical protein SRAE_1000278900 [Strongyloides ratti]
MLSNGNSKFILTAAASLAVGIFICKKSNIFKSFNKPTTLNKTIDEECGEISSGVTTSTDSTLKTITLEKQGKSLGDRSKQLRNERDHDNKKIEKFMSSSKSL